MSIYTGTERENYYGNESHTFIYSSVFIVSLGKIEKKLFSFGKIDYGTLLKTKCRPKKEEEKQQINELKRKEFAFEIERIDWIDLFWVIWVI